MPKDFELAFGRDPLARLLVARIAVSALDRLSTQSLCRSRWPLLLRRTHFDPLANDPLYGRCICQQPGLEFLDGNANDPRRRAPKRRHDRVQPSVPIRVIVRIHEHDDKLRKQAVERSAEESLEYHRAVQTAPSNVPSAGSHGRFERDDE